MTEDEIYARMPKDIIGVEDWNWYDGIAYYIDKKTWQKYSRHWYPIAGDELCKWWKIFKVKRIVYWKGTRDYKYEILSERPDEDDNKPSEVS